VKSPLTDAMLAPLETDCDDVLISGGLSDIEAHRLAELMAGRPDVMLLVCDTGLRRTPVTDLDFLRLFPWLTWLSILCNRLENIGGLTHLPQLNRLYINSSQSRAVSASPLAATAGTLQHLKLEIPVSRVGALSELTGLTTLTLRTVRMQDLSVLTPIAGLRSLDLKLGGTRDLSLLPAFSQLQYFEAQLVRGLADIRPLAEVPSLEEIFLDSLRNVTQLPPLDKLTRLRTITLRTMKGLTDLAPLLTAPSLEDVSISLEQLQPEDVAGSVKFSV
jgi:Leucine-rich repeat (LRR) protein